MTTFLLVHGGWVGGWYWRRVTPLLEAAGHRVLTPTLTGLGERAHLCSPTIDLDTHIEDVANVIQYEDLRNVVLVGHSYGGMVITGVAEHAPERLAHLCYLDAFVPEDGQALADLVGPIFVADAREKAQLSSDGSRVPMPFPLAAVGVEKDEDLAWMTPRLTAASPEHDAAAHTVGEPRSASCSTDLHILQESGVRVLRGVCSESARKLAVS